MGWSAHSHQAGANAGAVLGNQPESQAVLACFCLASGVSKHVHVFHKQSLGFLQPCCQSHWFSNKLRGLILPSVGPQTWAPNVWFKLLTPQGGSSSQCNPPPLLCPLRGAQVPTSSLLFPSYLTPRYSLGCMRVILPVSSLFQCELLHM